MSFHYSTYFSSVISISIQYSTYFSSAWRYKTFHLPILFSNCNVWNATLLAFLVHDVIKHFIFPYLFKPQRLKCNVTCFSSTWRYETFHFLVSFSRTFSNRNVWNTTLEISISCFSSTWRYRTFYFPVLFSLWFHSSTYYST
jgi:hypothetical protein